MTAADIETIERQLGCAAPSWYRATMLAYPFPRESFADECLIPNDPERVLGLNRDAPTVRGVARPFFVGDDGGEELYFVDLNTPDSPVYVFELETGKHLAKATNWTTYLAQVHSDLADIEKDKKAERERRSRKRWWQFWR